MYYDDVCMVNLEPLTNFEENGTLYNSSHLHCHCVKDIGIKRNQRFTQSINIKQFI